jgi:hypothetical protein
MGPALAAVSPPHRTALVIIALASLIGAAFGTSFTLALDRPTPRDIPAGLVVYPSTRLAAAGLEARTDGGLAFRPYPTTAAVENAIGRQQIYAGVVPHGPGARLLVASAAGSSVARVLEEAAGTRLPVVDVRPLEEGDLSGLLSFYLTLAATVTGFVTMFQLREHAPRLTVSSWFACIVGLALTAGLLLIVATGPVIGALHGLKPEVWAALAGMIAVAALWASTMQVLVGRWTFIPTFGFLMVLGMPSSGGAIAPPLLPAFYGFLERFLPSGATVETIRNAVYFPHDQPSEPILVLSSWIVCLAAALLIATRLRRQTPGGQPYTEGSARRYSRG